MAIAWRRDKKGFATPERHWLRVLHPTLRDLFHNAPRTSSYLNLAEVQATLSNSDFTDSLTASASVWRWAAAELWLRMLSAS